MKRLQTSQFGLRQPLPTLREILQRPLFAHAEVVAGREFLESPVRWVHVGEIPNIAAYLRGQELILSTAVGLRRPRERTHYLEQLASCKIAGVCIELGTYLRKVPDDMVRRAGQLGLPLIAFRENVRFVDITHDVLSLILKNEHHVLEALHTLGQELQQRMVEPQAPLRIMERLASWLDCPVVFLDDRDACVSVGRGPVTQVLEDRARQLLYTMSPTLTFYPDIPLDDGYVVARRVGALLPRGVVASICEGDDRVAVGRALDLAAVAIGIALGRERGMEVVREDTATVVMRELLDARLADADLRGALARIGHTNAVPAQAIVLRARSQMMDPTSLAHPLQEWLTMQGLHALTAPWETGIAALLLDPPPLATVRALVRHLVSGSWNPACGSLQLGLSRRTAIGALPNALREADQALSLTAGHSAPRSHFYQDLGALRLLLGLRGDFDLEAFCDDELGALLAYDKVHGGELLTTLQALLQTPDRSHAAQKLQVHRQTLYYRIHRLESLLGDDFLEPERRLALQLALCAQDYLGEDR